MGATIQMRVYDDHLSIWNEGALPYGLSFEDLKKEHSSRPRNPLIANNCFLMRGVVEPSKSLMLVKMQDYQNPKLSRKMAVFLRHFLLSRIKAMSEEVRK